MEKPITRHPTWDFHHIGMGLRLARAEFTPVKVDFNEGVTHLLLFFNSSKPTYSACIQYVAHQLLTASVKGQENLANRFCTVSQTVAGLHGIHKVPQTNCCNSTQLVWRNKNHKPKVTKRTKNNCTVIYIILSRKLFILNTSILCPPRHLVLVYSCGQQPRSYPRNKNCMPETRKMTATISAPL